MNISLQLNKNQRLIWTLFYLGECDGIAETKITRCANSILRKFQKSKKRNVDKLEIATSVAEIVQFARDQIARQQGVSSVEQANNEPNRFTIEEYLPPYCTYEMLGAVLFSSIKRDVIGDEIGSCDFKGELRHLDERGDLIADLLEKQLVTFMMKKCSHHLWTYLFEIMHERFPHRSAWSWEMLAGEVNAVEGQESDSKDNLTSTCLGHFSRRFPEVYGSPEKSCRLETSKHDRYVACFFVQQNEMDSETSPKKVPGQLHDIYPHLPLSKWKHLCKEARSNAKRDHMAELFDEENWNDFYNRRLVHSIDGNQLDSDILKEEDDVMVVDVVDKVLVSTDNANSEPARPEPENLSFLEASSALKDHSDANISAPELLLVSLKSCLQKEKSPEKRSAVLKQLAALLETEQKGPAAFRTPPSTQELDLGDISDPLVTSTPVSAAVTSTTATTASAESLVNSKIQSFMNTVLCSSNQPPANPHISPSRFYNLPSGSNGANTTNINTNNNSNNPIACNLRMTSCNSDTSLQDAQRARKNLVSRFTSANRPSKPSFKTIHVAKYHAAPKHASPLSPLAGRSKPLGVPNTAIVSHPAFKGYIVDEYQPRRASNQDTTSPVGNVSVRNLNPPQMSTRSHVLDRTGSPSGKGTKRMSFDDISRPMKISRENYSI